MRMENNIQGKDYLSEAIKTPGSNVKVKTVEKLSKIYGWKIDGYKILWRSRYE